MSRPGHPTSLNITALETKLLRNISENDYAPGNGAAPRSFAEVGAVWSNCLDCGPESIMSSSLPGVVASLVKKGLIWQDGKGKEATVCLTEEGYNAYAVTRSNDRRVPRASPCTSPAQPSRDAATNNAMGTTPRATCDESHTEVK